MKEEALLVCLRHERISSTAIAGMLILMEEACQEEYFETGNKFKMFQLNPIKGMFHLEHHI